MRKKKRGALAPTPRRSASSLAVSGLVLSLWLPTAMAEDKGEEKPKAAVNELPQVTVTATRSKTALMKTPVAVTAISSDDLLRDNIKEIRNLSGYVPNVQFGMSPADSGVMMAIRGVSSTNFTEIGDPAVAVHVDGIYSPRAQAALALMFDLDSVEVLRGAQGTLFGKGSTAGVINIQPGRPDFKRDYGWTSLQMGAYNARELRTVYNKSLGEKFALRVAYMREMRDGYITQERDMTDRGYRKSDGKGGFVSTPDGKPDVDQRLNRMLKPSEYYYNANQWAGRLSARWAISPSLEWQGTVERWRNKGAGDVQLRDCEMAAGTARACGPEGQWHAKINVPGMVDVTMDNYRNFLNWKLNDTMELQLRNSYSIQKRSQHQDNDGGLHAIESEVFRLNAAGTALEGGIPNVTDQATYVFGARYRTVVNELQFKQETKNWRYVMGAFQMHEKNAIDQGQDNLVVPGWPGLAYPGAHFWSQSNRQVKSRALFAQGDFKIAPAWTGTAGLRISRDGRSDAGGLSSENYSGQQTPWYYRGKHTPPPISQGMPHNGNDLSFEMGPFAGLKGYPAVLAENTKSETYKNSSYRLGLQFDADKNNMFFASLATAYRPGGFSDRTDRCGGPNEKCSFPEDEAKRIYFREYLSETTKNFELGYKGRLLNRKLDLSVVLFNTDFENMHYTNTTRIGVRKRSATYCDSTQEIGTTDCVVNGWVTRNIGKSSIRGMELEFKALPWQNGQIWGYVSLLDSKVKEWETYDDDWLCGVRAGGANPCPDRVLNTPGVDKQVVGIRQIDLRGKALPNSPKYSYALNYSHDFALGDDMSLTPTLSYRWQSRMYFTPRNLDDPQYGAFQKAYGNVNASVKLVGNNGKWDVELWGTNLSNNAVKTWMDPITTSHGIRASFAPPRMYGVRATVHY
ncbi:TonB-dependent receptor [Paucibacter sp. XJ19-41]|uniref:TonB-dependent receptor n=1 Tax=Paucibacter sp. XJ19-41 TaxID=2927824 RepID=UPI00234A8853|nr:TonB-dependent receptor [Paucibacter sp. XJ19-41]MDC6168736.1 TonB-dependent receptor [Paucibacter sp. XJ19-41]